jgi:hypothetical protein
MILLAQQYCCNAQENLARAIANLAMALHGAPDGHPATPIGLLREAVGHAKQAITDMENAQGTI